MAHCALSHALHALRFPRLACVNDESSRVRPHLSQARYVSPPRRTQPCSQPTRSGTVQWSFNHTPFRTHSSKLRSGSGARVCCSPPMTTQASENTKYQIPNILVTQVKPDDARVHVHPRRGSTPLSCCPTRDVASARRPQTQPRAQYNAKARHSRQKSRILAASGSSPPSALR